MYSKFNFHLLRCLLACLASNTPVPELPDPMYTAAMKGMIVTISGLEKAGKEKFQVVGGEDGWRGHSSCGCHG